MKNLKTEYPGTCIENGGMGPYTESIFDEGGLRVYQAFGRTEKQVTARRKELVKRFNMHNEALDIILSFVRESSCAQKENGTLAKAIDLLNRNKDEI